MKTKTLSFNSSPHVASSAPPRPSLRPRRSPGLPDGRARSVEARCQPPPRSMVQLGEQKDGQLVNFSYMCSPFTGGVDRVCKTRWRSAHLLEKKYSVMNSYLQVLYVPYKMASHALSVIACTNQDDVTYTKFQWPYKTGLRRAHSLSSWYIKADGSYLNLDYKTS